MKRLTKYIHLLRINLQLGMQYRANTLFLLTIIIIPPLAYFYLWHAIYTEKNLIGDYTFSQMVTYYIISYLFFEMSPTPRWNIANDIKDGRISLWLTKPLNHFFSFFSMSYGYIVLWWFFALLGGTLLFLILQKYIVLPSKLSPFFISFLFAFLGGILKWTIEYLLLILAFWLERPFGIVRLQNFAIYFFAGTIIPLDLLPFKNFFLALPFKYISFFPAQIFLGKTLTSNLLKEFLLLFLWVFISIFLAHWIFEMGRRKYAAPGG